MAEYLDPAVSSVIGLVDTYLKWKDSNGEARGFERYHPSAFGNCLRKMQYQRFEERGLVEGEKENHEAPLCRIWGNGHSMHDRWREYFEELGVLKGYWQCTNPLCAMVGDDGSVSSMASLYQFYKDPKGYLSSRRIHGKDKLQGCFKPEKCVCGWTRFKYHEIDVVDKELNFYGHADMILDFCNFDASRFESVKQLYNITNLPTKPIVVDMKSINHFDFQEVAKGNPHSYYKVQLTIYANILDCEYGILIYENKNNQRTAAFKIERNADTVWQDIKRQATLMNEMVEVKLPDGSTDHLLPPPRPYFKDSKDCTYCGFKNICHNSAIWQNENLPQIRKDFYGDLLDQS